MSAKSFKALARQSAAKPAKRPARALLTDVREMILQARVGVARAVDSGLVALYGHVGRLIRQELAALRASVSCTMRCAWRGRGWQQ
jgi:hypothetical protein